MLLEQTQVTSQNTLYVCSVGDWFPANLLLLNNPACENEFLKKAKFK